jgi:AcrR family transcriptional regulator
MPLRYHHGDLRAALLARAEQTLRERGLGALSLRELARDLGVSNAAPSRHFKDKQALLDALALAGFDRLIDALVASQRSGGSFADRLRALAGCYADFAATNAELLDMMYTAKHASAASESLVAAGSRLGEIALALIAEGQRAGEVRSGAPESLGLVLFSAVHGYAGLVASGVIPAQVAEVGLDHVIEHLLRGLRPD